MLNVISHQEIQIKTAMRFHYTSVRIVKFKKPIMLKAGKYMEEPNSHIQLGGIKSGKATWKQFGSFSKS